MYKKILVTLDLTATDRVIMDHVKPLAALMKSEVIFLHVADSVPAKYHGEKAAGKDIEERQQALDAAKAEFVQAGIPTEWALAYGDPPKEIVHWVKTNGCDLIAMGTHGHQFVADLVLGTTAIRVQHGLSVPVLMLRAGSGQT
jgi:nucleotide-binding universal stress UspA family protein